MRTSIDVPDPLLRQAKRVARDRRVTLRHLLLEGLRSVLEQQQVPSQHHMTDCSFGEGGLVEGLSWSDADRMTELVYEDHE